MVIEFDPEDEYIVIDGGSGYEAMGRGADFRTWK